MYEAGICCAAALGVGMIWLGEGGVADTINSATGDMAKCLEGGFTHVGCVRETGGTQFAVPAVAPRSPAATTLAQRGGLSAQEVGHLSPETVNALSQGLANGEWRPANPHAPPLAKTLAAAYGSLPGTQNWSLSGVASHSSKPLTKAGDDAVRGMCQRLAAEGERHLMLARCFAKGYIAEETWNAINYPNRPRTQDLPPRTQEACDRELHNGPSAFLTRCMAEGFVTPEPTGPARPPMPPRTQEACDRELSNGSSAFLTMCLVDGFITSEQLLAAPPPAPPESPLDSCTRADCAFARDVFEAVDDPVKDLLYGTRLLRRQALVQLVESHRASIPEDILQSLDAKPHTSWNAVVTRNSAIYHSLDTPLGRSVELEVVLNADQTNYERLLARRYELVGRVRIEERRDQPEVSVTWTPVDEERGSLGGKSRKPYRGN